MSVNIEYRFGNDLNLDQVIDLYVSSTLGERRPVHNRERMRRMIANANLVITAWDEETMAGIARSLTDSVYCTYLSDLAVRVSHQKRGIGRELIRLTKEHSGSATLILLAAPKAAEYYPHIGFRPHLSAWVL